MAKQTRPFIVEIKSSRKTKTSPEKSSIWGTLNLKPDPDLDVPSIATGHLLPRSVVPDRSASRYHGWLAGFASRQAARCPSIV